MPDSTPPLDALLAARIANPGHYLPRHTDSTGPYEAISRWAARAIAAGLDDGSLGYVPAASQLHRTDFDRLAAERDRWKNNFGTAQAEADRLAVELRQAHYDIARQLDTLASPGMLQMWAETCDPRPTTTEDVLRAVAEKLRRDGGPAPVPGSSRRAPEAEPTGVHAWSETAGLSFVVTACTRCGIVQRRDGETGPCHGPDRLELRAQEAEPTDDELAAEIDRAEDATEAETRAHAQGYAEAVARLRDDDRYRDWWTSGGVKPDAPIRRHLADYLETVGPDGVDVETGRWPAREHAVHDALVAAKPGDVFAFDQQPGQRVLIVVAAADCAPDSTTGSCCPSCGSRYPRRIPAGEDQRCWTCWLADPGAGESPASELTARCQCGHPHAAHEGPERPGRRCVLCFGCNAFAAELPAQVTEPAPAAPKLAQGGIIRRDTGPIVGEDQLLERLEALPVEPAIADEAGR